MALLQNIDTEAVDVEGRTPSHYAAMMGKADVLKYLMKEVYIEVGARDHVGHTPLTLAIENAQE